ncbi:restriction endonuclease subunit S [Loktanella salsilacus]|uniref:restriction endonuclease subunit S n=1 Tax=Loktanella salsilacus TaxID=195913 RepID=UPI003704C9B8
MVEDGQAKYQPYPAYKPSGVMWLGDIPEEWKASKLKYETKFQVGWTPPTKTDENFVGANKWANISDLGTKTIKDTVKRISDLAATKASMSITPSGSLLYSFKLSVGLVSFAGEDMYTNEAIASFLPSGEIPLSYLYYALPIFVIQNASTNIYGARILNQELIRGADIAVPPFDAAAKIAAFLDIETAKIDALIAKQQRLISLLEEKRQAVICHAVTKGLDPTATLRPSGIDWLGDVPAHWKVKRAKHVSNIFVPQRNKPDLNEDNGVAWATMDDMKSKFIQETRLKVEHASAVKSGSKVLQAGAVIASCVGNFGAASINQIAVIINQQLQAFIPTQIKAKYLRELVSLSKAYFEQVGTAATLIYVNQQGFENLPVLLPPTKEQDDICKFVGEQDTKFDALLPKAQKAITLLKERRTALISAAVTGKIDLRDWQPPVGKSDLCIQDSSQTEEALA